LFDLPGQASREGGKKGGRKGRKEKKKKIGGMGKGRKEGIQIITSRIRGQT